MALTTNPYIIHELGQLIIRRPQGPIGLIGWRRGKIKGSGAETDRRRERVNKLTHFGQ